MTVFPADRDRLFCPPTSPRQVSRSTTWFTSSTLASETWIAFCLFMCCHIAVSVLAGWLTSIVTLLALCYLAGYRVLSHCWLPCYLANYRVLPHCWLCVSWQVTDCCHIAGSVLPDRLPSVVAFLSLCYLANYRVLPHCWLPCYLACYRVL